MNCEISYIIYYIKVVILRELEENLFYAHDSIIIYSIEIEIEFILDKCKE